MHFDRPVHLCDGASSPLVCPTDAHSVLPFTDLPSGPKTQAAAFIVTQIFVLVDRLVFRASRSAE